MSPPEAFWRLAKFKMDDTSHEICRLSARLPNNERVVFIDGHEQEAVDNVRGRHTTLTAWFQLNVTDANARLIMYRDIPRHYVFMNHTWVLRRRGVESVIGRIFNVNPRLTEQFHLRILLLHIPGALSFEDLRTVDNHLYLTCADACDAHHLIANDQEWENSMRQATSTHIPFQLRKFFAAILDFCNVSGRLQLWNTFRLPLIEDFLNLHADEIRATDQGLHHLKSLLRHELKYYPLPIPNILQDNDVPPNVEVETFRIRASLTFATWKAKFIRYYDF